MRTVSPPTKGPDQCVAMATLGGSTGPSSGGRNGETATERGS